MKVKVDKHINKHKSRTYKVLIFPGVENTWGYNDFSKDDQ